MLGGTVKGKCLRPVTLVMSDRQLHLLERRDYKMDAGGKSGQSVSNKSVKSTTSKTKKEKSQTDAEIKRLDRELEQNEETLDKHGAYYDVLSEQRMRADGEVFQTEGEIPTELHKEEVYNRVMEDHDKDIHIMEERQKSLTRRQKVLDVRKVLMSKRLEVEIMVMEQQLQEREMALMAGEKLVRLKERQRAIEQQERELKARGMVVTSRGSQAGEDTDIEEKVAREWTQKWIEKSNFEGATAQGTGPRLMGLRQQAAVGEVTATQ